MLDDHTEADEKTDGERRVENPGPVFVAQCAQQEKEENEIEKRPDSAHAFEVPEEAVHTRRRKKRREGGRAQKGNQCPEDWLTAQIDPLAAEAEGENEDRGARLDEGAEIQVARHHVREKETVPYYQRHQHSRGQQHHDCSPPRRLRRGGSEDSHRSRDWGRHGWNTSCPRKSIYHF